MIRKKETRSGGLLEVDFYPVNRAGKRIPGKRPAPRTKAELRAQKEYEKRRAEKKLVRMVNANFNEEDFFLHPTYEPMFAPLDEERAHKDIVNYFARIKRKRASELKKIEKQLHALPENDVFADVRKEMERRCDKLRQPFKYLYCIERVVYKTGMYAGLPNYHFHIFMSGGLTAAQIEGLWHKGIKVNANSYKPEMFGAEAAAKYIAKDPQGTRRFKHSKNLLKISEERIKDGVCKPAHLKKLCEERDGDRVYWQQKYKGYQLLKTYPRYNEWNGQWYLTVVLYRTGGSAPPWEFNAWGACEDL